MNGPLLLEKLFSRAHPAVVFIAGAGILAGLYTVPVWLNKRMAEEIQFQKNLSPTLDQSAVAREHMGSMAALKANDLDQLKTGLSGHALTQKSLFESGFSLHEERRLLEKQLEIMTTYLMIDPSLQRVFLMREEQPLQSYLLNYIPLRAFGGAGVHLPNTVHIISKERFAHPERGKSEEVNGTLQYNPPQVGTSVRSNALGEFVMFTNSGLIIHGPPLNEEDHAKFPHVCLGLDREAARKLYRGSFIGTRILLKHILIDRAEPDVAPSTGPALSSGTVAGKP